MAIQTPAPVGEAVVLTPTANDDPAFKYDLKEDDPEEELDEETYKKKTLQQKILWGVFYTIASLASLYFFMVAVKLIGDGFTLALGCDAKGAFDFANNPVAGLMIGTISTALLHSSGTVTSITVALVGAGGMTIRQGVYVVMGANIGTCVTCIMVAFGQVGDPIRFQRAMAAATVHDMYNIWSVIVMFPIEVLFHPLEKMSIEMSNAKTNGGAFKSPVDAIVNPLTQEILVVDKNSIYDVATGDLELVFGWLIACIAVLFFCGVLFWYKKKGGKELWYDFLERKRVAREQRKAAEAEEKKSFIGEDAA
ncbi:Calcium-transporting ATPase [Phytophthora nicotianae]|uniref:Calcium-transporting ATPase n=1 Tax=Phytophthora nicotianae TaxID=4792 RepID=A0A0W8DSM9_PHYNI|nr:Calcium-transporting ATPase [Phytophthora nicotianae]